MTTDLYAALGVERDATTEEIRAAYRNQAKRHHPDAGGDAKKFALIKLAEDVLKDARRRANYDETGDIDDAPIDNEQAQILQLLAQFIMHILKLCEESKRDPLSMDFVQAMRVSLNDREKELTQANKVLAVGAKAYRDLGARFIANQERNVLKDMLNNEAAKLERMISMNTEVLELIPRARELLENYSFDQRSMFTFTFS